MIAKKNDGIKKNVAILFRIFHEQPGGGTLAKFSAVLRPDLHRKKK
jgi:hypothetical protein